MVWQGDTAPPVLIVNEPVCPARERTAIIATTVLLPRGRGAYDDYRRLLAEQSRPPGLAFIPTFGDAIPVLIKFIQHSYPHDAAGTRCLPALLVTGAHRCLSSR